MYDLYDDLVAISENGCHHEISGGYQAVSKERHNTCIFAKFLACITKCMILLKFCIYLLGNVELFFFFFYKCVNFVFFIIGLHILNCLCIETMSFYLQNAKVLYLIESN